MASVGEEFGSIGRVGVLVPPANTTVEPELSSVMPDGVSLHFARLPGRVSNETSVGLRERFEGYVQHLADVADSFGGCKLAATCLAVTGASYLVGAKREAALVDGLRSGGAPKATTAALAVSSLLKVLKSKRIGLVTPYPPWLVEFAKQYWSDLGFEVVHIVPLPDVVSIYSVGATKVLSAVREILLAADAQAIVLSGTGVTTMPTIERLAGTTSVPVISSNLSLAWWITTSLELDPTSPSSAPALRALAKWLPQGAQG